MTIRLPSIIFERPPVKEMRYCHVTVKLVTSPDPFQAVLEQGKWYRDGPDKQVFTCANGHGYGYSLRADDTNRSQGTN